MSLKYKIKDAWNQIRWTYQRVVNRYDERVAWGVGYYLNDVMPEILQHIKTHKQGVPAIFFKDVEDVDISDDERKKAEDKFDSVLDELTWAFEEMKWLQEEWDIKDYPDAKKAMTDYRKRERLAKAKLHLLIDYYWELGY